MEPETMTDTAQEHSAERDRGRQPEPSGEGTERLNHYVENLASRTPTLFFVFAAFGAMIVSALLQGRKERHLSLFVGQWAPSLLLLGLFNKLSKTMGMD